MHLNIASMPIVPLFLCKLSVSLAVVWGFYQVVLRRLTFHGLNRWYLFAYTLISFLIPLINIGPMLPDGPAGESVLLQYIPAIGIVSRGAVAAASHRAAGLSAWTAVLWVLAAGSVLLLARLILRWLSLIRLRRNARLIEGNGMKIYQVDGPITPFSFGNTIYINQHLHSEKEWTDIILHEFVHMRQKHTLDILLAELVCILNWYNPFAWLIRYSIRQNLEFIADRQVLKKGVDRKDYQYHLLKVMREPRYRLANNFNFSSLKKRIVMMNKMRSARLHLLKLLFLLPLMAVLLVAFRDKGARLFGSHNSDEMERSGSLVRRMIGGVRDTVPGKRKDTANTVIRLHRGDTVEPLYVIDDVIVPRDSLKNLRTDQIASIRVLKDSAAKKKYGEKGENGVVQIYMKGMNGTNAFPKDVLYFVDGREMDRDSVNKLNPHDIESITVLKDSANTEKYGEKGRNGVILIKLKHPGGGGVTPHGQAGVRAEDKDGRYTIGADSLEIGNLKVTAVKAEGN